MAHSHFHGPLRVCQDNPRYFTDDTGRPIYLTGCHTWSNLQDLAVTPADRTDYPAFLELLSSYGMNHMRMWQWGQAERAPWTHDVFTVDPLPYLRTGPGAARDGKPKFDLARWNPAYFQRLRQRVEMAGERGIYVAPMFFEAWHLKWPIPEVNAWHYHTYHPDNNVQGIGGEPAADGRPRIFSLDLPAVLEVQKAFVRKVIDTLNDLDNVLWEIVNEIFNDYPALLWHYHMVDYVRAYEKTLPRQHPVGMTAEGGTQDNQLLWASSADWISPGFGPDAQYQWDPPAGNGKKVVIADTDHLWGSGGNYRWAWKSFTRGLNPIFMDHWQPLPGTIEPRHAASWGVKNRRDFADWEPLRRSLGYTRRFALRMDLARCTPRGDLASSRYCLADPGREYLVYIPDDCQVWLKFDPPPARLAVEWFDPRTGASVTGDEVQPSKHQVFVSPLGSDTVLYLRGR